MRCGKTATNAANSPTPSPSTSSNTFSIATSMANVRAGKPAARSRANSPRRSKMFRHCTTASPMVPNKSPSPPRLWNVARYVFCTAAKVLSRSTVVSRSEAVVAQLLLQGLLDRGRLARRGLDEEVAVADHGRIVTVKIVFAHQQVALEDAVFQQPGDLKIERAIVGVVDGECLAASVPKIERVVGGRLIEHDGDRALVLPSAARCVGREHLPGVGHVRGVGPGEAAAVDEFRAHAQQARLPRLIEVQAACLVARLDAEGVETALGQQFLLVGIEADLLAALGRVEIEVDRQLALADQGKAAAAAGAIVGLPGGIDAKHAHGRDQEAGRGRQPDGQGTAAGVAGRIAERQAEQVASPAGHRRPGRAAAELQVDQRQQRHQRQRARPEEGADLCVFAQLHEAGG